MDHQILRRRRNGPRPMVLALLVLGGVALAVSIIAARTKVARATLERGVSWATTRAQLEPGQQAFLARMRAATPASVPLTATSGYRSPTGQAAALIAKLAAGATLEGLRKLYGNSPAIQELLRYPTTSWPSVLSAQVARGVYLSRHMRWPPDAIDVRVRGLSKGQIDALIAGAKAAGARKAFFESSPAHLHVEGGMT